MTDSLQKIIEQCDYYAINSMPGSYEQTSFLVLKSRLEALRENPYRWMDQDGDMHKSGDLKDVGYTIPIIIGA